MLAGGENDAKRKLTRKFRTMQAHQKLHQRQLTEALKKWDEIVIMPNEDIKSTEAVRPFIIMQPIYDT